MQDAKVEARIRRKFRLVAVELDERRRRQWAATEAREIGWGGISLVARATGLSRPTIMAGLRDLQLSSKSRAAAAARVRRPGGGRRALTQADPGLLQALEQLIEPATRGDPMSGVAKRASFDEKTGLPTKSFFWCALWALRNGPKLTSRFP